MKLFHASLAQEPKGILTQLGTFEVALQHIDGLFATETPRLFDGKTFTVCALSNWDANKATWQLTPLRRESPRETAKAFADFLSRATIYEVEIPDFKLLSLKDCWGDDPIGSGGLSLFEENTDLSDKERAELAQIFGPFITPIYLKDVKRSISEQQLKQMKVDLESDKVFKNHLADREKKTGKPQYITNLAVEIVWGHLTMQLRNWAIQNGYEGFAFKNYSEGNGQLSYVTLKEGATKIIRTLKFDPQPFLRKATPLVENHSRRVWKKSARSGEQKPKYKFWKIIDIEKYWIPATSSSSPSVEKVLDTQKLTPTAMLNSVTDSPLADFVIESGRHATSYYRDAIWPVGRDLVPNPKGGRPGAKRFVFNEDIESLLDRLNALILFEDFATQYKRIIIPSNSIWLESITKAQNEGQEVRTLRHGYLAKKTGNTITAHHVCEITISDATPELRDRNQRGVIKLGAHVRNGRLIHSQGMELNFDERGITTGGQSLVDYFEANKEKVPDSIKGKRSAEESANNVLRDAEYLFRLLVILSSRNIETNISQYQSHLEKPISLWIRLSDELEKALETGDIRMAKELLGWTDRTLQSPVVTLQTPPLPPTPNNETPAVNSLVKPTWAEDKSAVLLNLASEFTPKLVGETAQIASEASGALDKADNRSAIINSVFHRLALVRLSKIIQPLPFPYTVNLAQLEFFPVETAKRMDLLLTEAEQKLRFAMPYQFSTDAASITIPEDSFAITKDRHLPSPVTWIEWIRDSDLANSVGVLLVEDKQEKIRATVFLARDVGDKTSFNADNQDVPNYMKPQLRKIAAVGYYKNPLMIISDITFNLNEGVITMPNDESITLAVGQTNDGIPVVTDRRSFSGTESKEQTAGFNKDMRKYAEIALAFANALTTGDPRIQATSIARRRPSDDSLAIKLGKAPQRAVSIVTLNPDYILHDLSTPDASDSTDTMIRADGDQKPDLGLLDPLQQQEADQEGSSIPDMDTIVAAEQMQNAAPANAEIAPQSSHLNSVFERFAKIRVAKRGNIGVDRYEAGFEGKDLMPKNEQAAMERFLGLTEKSLRAAITYRFVDNSRSLLLDDKKYFDEKDFTLPAPITWIDNCSPTKEGAGALLMDDGNSRLSITLFLEPTSTAGGFIRTRSDEEKKSESDDLMSSHRQYRKVLRKINAISDVQRPLLILPGIIYDKSEKKFWLAGSEAVRPYITQISIGYPLIRDATRYYEKFNDEDMQGFKDENVLFAQQALTFANAIAKQDSRLSFEAAIQPRPGADILVINSGLSIKRDMSLVTVNPDFIPASDNVEISIQDQPAVNSIQESNDEDHEAEILEENEEATLTGETEESPEGEIVLRDEDFQTIEELKNIRAAGGNNSETPASKEQLNLSPTTLSEEELFELKLKHDDAFKETKIRLLADAEMYLMQAQNNDFLCFECRLDFKKSNFPIQLCFSEKRSVEEGKKPRKSIHILEKYDTAYQERNLTLTMNDAVDLLLAVQSMIYNAEGIIPVEKFSVSGRRMSDLNRPIPLPIISHNLIRRTGGTCSVELKGIDPFNGQIVKTSIPLGIALRHEHPVDEERELNARLSFVLDYLIKKGNERSQDGHGFIIQKRYVLELLRRHLREQGREWVAPMREPLPGCEKSTLIYKSPKGVQRIMLGPVVMQMDSGGDNPSWKCILNFYVGDKNKNFLGERVRTSIVDLHTRDNDLAIARAYDTLTGASNGQFIGLLDALNNHMHATDDEWKVVERRGSKEAKAVKAGKAAVVKIGDKPLQDFLNDMNRYEKDIGVRLVEQKVGNNGDVTITIEALRSLTADSKNEVTKFQPETVYENEKGKRKPIAFTLTIPASKYDRIDAFVEVVLKDLRKHTNAAFNSTAKGVDDNPDKRKKPLEYRVKQIHWAVIRALEARYQEYFGQTLPRNWHKSKTGFADSAAAVTDRKAYHAQPQSSIPFAGERFARHARPAHRSNLILG